MLEVARLMLSANHWSTRLVLRAHPPFFDQHTTLRYEPTAMSTNCA